MAEWTDVAHLRRRLSFVLEQTILSRMHHHLCKQGETLAGTRQLRSQGPESIHAHWTERVTGFEGQEGTNRAGGRIGVGGRNGDGNGV